MSTAGVILCRFCVIYFLLFLVSQGSSLMFHKLMYTHGLMRSRSETDFNIRDLSQVAFRAENGVETGFNGVRNRPEIRVSKPLTSGDTSSVEETSMSNVSALLDKELGTDRFLCLEKEDIPDVVDLLSSKSERPPVVIKAFLVKLWKEHNESKGRPTDGDDQVRRSLTTVCSALGDKKVRDVSHLPVPGGKPYRGFQDPRPVKVFLRGVQIIIETNELCESAGYRYLCKCLSEQVLYGLVEQIPNQTNRLQKAETYLLTTYKATNDTTKIHSALMELKQESTIDEYLDRYKEILSYASSLEVTFSQGHAEYCFRKGLTQEYRAMAAITADQSIDSLAARLRIYERECKPAKSKEIREVKRAVPPFRVQANRIQPRPDDVVCRYYNVLGRCTNRDCKLQHIKGFVCYTCGEKGHLAKDCPKAEAGKKVGVKSVEVDDGTPDVVSEGYIGFRANVSRVGVHASPTDAVEVSDPWTIKLQTDGTSLSALLDPGAGVDLMDTVLASKLVEKGKGRFVQLSSPLELEFGNSSTVCCSKGIQLKSLEGLPPEVNSPVFVCCEDLKPNVIIGRSTIEKSPSILDRFLQGKKRGFSDILRISVSRATPIHLCKEPCDFVVEELPDKSLKVHHRLYDEAPVAPRVERARRRNEVDRKIIQHLVDRLEAEDKVMKISSNKAIIVNELVLCDKWTSKKPNRPRSFPLAGDESSRYRVTIDLKPLNALKYLDGIWITDEELMIKPVNSSCTSQFQRTALNIWRQWPSENKRFYGKIDCREAFFSVKISSSLSRLMCFRGMDNQMYQFTALPQGWKLSPLYFARALEYVLNQCRPSLPRDCQLDHYQDDILLCAPSRELCQEATDIVTETLTRYHFKTSKEKNEGPAEELTFCGYRIKGPTLLPLPGRTEVTESAVEVALERFRKLVNLADLKTFLRTWAGMFNFMSSWLTPDLKAHQQNLFAALKRLGKNACLGKLEREEVETSLRELTKAYLYDIAPLYGMSSYGTICVVDANQDAWCGCILAIMKRSDFLDITGTEPIPFEFGSLLHDTGLDPSEWMLTPTKWDGARWSATDSRRHSTYRERMAAYLLVYKNRGCLSGPITVASDNLNVGRTTHDIEDFYTASLIKYHEYFQRTVQKVVHVSRRDAAISLIDSVARTLGHRNFHTGANPVRLLGDTKLPARKRPRWNPTTHQIEEEEEEQEYIPLPGDPAALSADVSDDKEDLPELEEVLQDHGEEPEGDPDSGDDDANIRAIPFEDMRVQDDREVAHLLDAGILRNDGEGTYKVAKGRLEGATYVPRGNWIPMIKGLHALGHPGVKGTSVYFERYKFFIPGLSSKIRNVIRSCAGCTMGKSGQGKSLGHLPRPSAPGELVCMDFFGPLRGRSLLVLQDRYSRWLDVEVVTNRDSPTVAWALAMWSARYGFPRAVMTDNAPAFLGESVREFMRRYGIHHQTIAVYHPEANGSIERAMRTLMEGIRAMAIQDGANLEELGKDWVTYLPLVLQRINTLSNARDVLFTYLERCPIMRRKPGTIPDYKGDLSVGQHVALKTVIGDKLNPRFSGRFTVKKRVGNNVYELEEIPLKYHRNRLKIWEGGK